MKKKLFTLMLGLMLVGAGCASATSQSSSNHGSSSADSSYVDYSPTVLHTVQSEGDALLFFHAAWCPTCRSAELDILQNGDLLPEDLTIVKVDYDSERDLKRQYNVTRQHTFVQVDSAGNEVKKWIGGSVALINQQIEL